jgi:hypothetical protein
MTLNTQSEAPMNAASPGNSPAMDTPATETEVKAIETKAEPQTEAPKEPAKEDIDLSARFASLSRKEKKLLAERQAISAEKKELEEYKKWKASAKEKPFEYLSQGGITLDDLIKAKLTEGKEPTVEDKLLTVEEKLKKFQEDREVEAEKLKQQNSSRAVAAFKDKIKSVVEIDKAKYETILANDAIDEVYDVCAEYWEQNPHLPPEKRMLPVEKAAELVEAELFEREKERAKKTISYSKLKSLYASQETPKETVPQAKDIQAPEPTLTNKTAPAPSAEQRRLLTREESIKQLAKELDEKWRAARKG